MPRIIQLRTSREEEDFIRKNNLCVILFKSNGCGHCIHFVPIYDELSDNYPQAAFGIVEASQVKIMNITGYPTLVVYRDGECIDVIVGANQERLEQDLGQNLTATKRAR